MLVNISRNREKKRVKHRNKLFGVVSLKCSLEKKEVLKLAGRMNKVKPASKP